MLNGDGLGDRVSETDPQVTGAAPLDARALSDDSQKTADAVNAFIAAAQEILGGRDKANMVLLRGFSGVPHLPDFGENFRLNPAAIAAYPMYRGLAKLVGMKVLTTGQTFADELTTLLQNFHAHDFFFVHSKPY